MKITKSIQIKAIFMLAIFSLNTAIGFACSIGMDMGYNSTHHQQKSIEADVHSHADGNNHTHQSVEVESQTHSHSNGKEHNHNNTLQKSLPVDTDIPMEDDCCTDQVNKFNVLDKNITQQLIGLENRSLIEDVDVFFNNVEIINLAVPVLHSSRYLFPPPPNILVSIQKFQI